MKADKDFRARCEIKLLTQYIDHMIEKYWDHDDMVEDLNGLYLRILKFTDAIIESMTPED